MTDDRPAVPDPPRIDRVLVPVDGSEAAYEAVDHAAAIAARYDAEVHALFVYGPEQGRGIAAEEDHAAIAEEGESTLESVRGICEARSIPVTCSTAVGFSTTRLSRHPGSVVLDCAEDVDADFLVIPREQGIDQPGTLAQVAEYVLAYASQPVLSV